MMLTANEFEIFGKFILAGVVIYCAYGLYVIVKGIVSDLLEKEEG